MQFSSDLRQLASTDVWEYDCLTKRRNLDVIDEVVGALNAPADFPPMDAAIVPGDRVAIALDPNIPQIENVLSGVFKTLSQSDISGIDIVFWEEASDEIIRRAKSVCDEHSVSVHRSDRREGLRYLAADDDADPVYLNRTIVDADFVLPVQSVRSLDGFFDRDLTGIFPSLADSAAQSRFFASRETVERKPAVVKMSRESRFLLGVQLVLTVTVNAEGSIGEIIAGTPEAIGKRVLPIRRQPDEFPPNADLVVASLDGDAQQQTWPNAVRAAEAACRYTQPEGTIVVWTDIDTLPHGSLQRIDGNSDRTLKENLMDGGELIPGDALNSEDGFPKLDPQRVWADALSRVMSEHRVLIRTNLESADLESMGVGVIETASELAHLSESFATCGVLRAAQFAGSTHPSPYQPSWENVSPD